MSALSAQADPTGPRVVRPTTVADAVAALQSGGPDAQPLAGATWVMRSPVRGERLEGTYVSLAGVAGLRDLDTGPPLRIGAAVTHARLAAALAGDERLRGLATAAGRSANPAVREVATVGGNLCTSDFAAADLVPALLALDAEVELAGPGGAERRALADFLPGRAELPAGTLVTGVTVTRPPARSAHARLTLRSAGDYPVAIVSAAVDDETGALRLAVGSVERVARRWSELEDELGAARDAAAAAEAAKRLAPQLDARDGVEAPGWYRAQVLPALVRRAVAELND